MNHYFLIYDAKQGGTFELGRWRSSTSPDLCFVSKETLDHPLQARKTIGTAKIPKESTPFGSIGYWHQPPQNRQTRATLMEHS